MSSTILKCGHEERREFLGGHWRRCGVCYRTSQCRSKRLKLEREQALIATRPRPERCECCGGPPTGRYPILHLDHIHGREQEPDGGFRGWLCASCNKAIGALGDDAAGLQRALAYLTRAEAAPYRDHT